MDRTRQIGSLQLKCFYGSDIETQFEQLAQLRIRVFREFPYLYEGSKDYEKKYLKRYCQSPRGFLAALFQDDQLIGASTALPLVDEDDFVKNPFLQLKIPLEKVFYFGESLLLEAYRGRGLGHVFFDEREHFALSFSDIQLLTFCAVIREDSHLQKPVTYRPLNGFWESRGYQIDPRLKSHFSWTDLGETHETEKQMQFWIKSR